MRRGRPAWAPERTPAPRQQSLASRFSELTRPSASVYAQRRRLLCSTLLPNSVLIVPAADEMAFSNDVLYPFHQDAMFFHLFGLHAPLRRSLSPPTAVATEDLCATMAAFTKDASGVAKVLLFVPEATRDVSTAVWATQPHTVDQVTKLVACGGESQTGGESVHVFTNRVEHIAETLVNEVARMLGAQCANLRASPTEFAADASLELKRLLPAVQLALPSQVRMHSERYRMLPPPTVPSVPALHFVHPLEALLAHLLAASFDLPSSAYTASAGGPRLRLTYTLPAARSGGVTGEALPLLAPPKETVATLRDWRQSARADPRGGAGHVQYVPAAMRSAREALWRYRLRKQPHQLAQHLLSARVTRDAFLAAMRAATATTSEFDIHCAFDGSLLHSRRLLGAAGAVQPAYVPVIAAGEHATEIHYVENNGSARAGDLVRLDGGAMVCHVPTDCTRTFPLAQTGFARESPTTDAYCSLLVLQRRLMKAIRVGVSPYDVARQHVSWTCDHLSALGVRGGGQTHRTLTRGDATPGGTEGSTSTGKDTIDPSFVHGVFCAHGYGHFMGIDLHEKFVGEPILCAPKGDKTTQKPVLSYSPALFDGGMMHTVEPGFYFPSATRAAECRFDARTVSLVPPALRGTGMQIEDDVFVLPTHPSPHDAPTRVDYLTAALRTHRDLLQWDMHVASSWPHDWWPLCSLLGHRHSSPALQRLDTSSLAFASVSFLFEQRSCMEGVPAALMALPDDLAQCTVCFSPSDSLASAAAWSRFATLYPFDVIVTTACVPKDVEDIEHVMSATV